METEKSYIVISHYAFSFKSISLSLQNTMEDALKEAQKELNAKFITKVEVYESDKARFSFFGRLIFEYSK